jgi:two-component system LytT family response regulator
MKVLIVDDETLAITRLQHLMKTFPDAEVLGSAKTVEDAVKKIVRLRPEVVLIDVEIGNSTGYDIIDEVDETGFRPKYIVVTAFSQYAITGIRKQVNDYLLKPIDLSDLKAALERIKGNLGRDDLLMKLAEAEHLTNREK